MIKVGISENKEEKGIFIVGHADYAEEGKDIVCASVSTIYQMAIMGLRALAEQYPENVEIMEVKEDE